MLDQILQIIFPDNLDQIRSHVRRPDLDPVDVPRTPSRTDVILPDVDGRTRTRQETENGVAWDADAETRRMSLTDADVEELAARGLADKDRIKIAAYIKGMVYAGKSRREIVRDHPTDQYPGFSDGNIGKIMAALNAVRNNTPTPTEGRG